MTFRGRSEKYYKIRINKTKGRERYGQFDRQVAGRTAVWDGHKDSILEWVAGY